MSGGFDKLKMSAAEMGERLLNNGREDAAVVEILDAFQTPKVVLDSYKKIFKWYFVVGYCH